MLPEPRPKTVVTALSSSAYQTISRFLEQQAGIRLGDGKEYLVSSRLSHLLKEHGLKDFAELAMQLERPGKQALQLAVLDAMTTNETFWFRDPTHFRCLTHGILAPQKLARARIWSAAASTGQEAYTLAISLQDAIRDGTLARTFRYEILGTDISPSALAQARHARYCGVATARGLTDQQRAKYFRQDGECIEVLPEYRKDITFREFNLMQRLDGLGRFDVIFCRNVLIYFSQERKRQLIERFVHALNPGGYLLLGSTESMSAHSDLFEMQRLQGALVYRRRG